MLLLAWFPFLTFTAGSIGSFWSALIFILLFGFVLLFLLLFLFLLVLFLLLLPVSRSGSFPVLHLL
jgi:hypothetical protein